MSTPRQPLYQRLPEMYRIKDAEQHPAGQLQAFLTVLNEVMAGVRDNIEALYHDLFIETCDDWVVPYIADLLGTSHLAGEAWTLRADVARTVFHRRRKGTLGAIESLTYTLSGWAAQAVELRNRLVWNQHLNHQRPDAGGRPPLTLRHDITSAVRGGTVTLRDPALLTFLNGPFDPFAHVVDVKPGQVGTPRYNLPNLGVFIWRLKDYLVPVGTPGAVVTAAVPGAGPGEAAAVVRCIIHPQGDPLVLFNTHRYRADDDPPDLSHPDEVPGPMPWPRLSADSPHGNPTAYVRVNAYTGAVPTAPGADSPGLVLHVPAGVFAGTVWHFRGANLCAWEAGLHPPLREYEIVIDPEHGRVLFGLTDEVTEAVPLAQGLFVSYTYGFSGPTGAHPISRAPTPTLWQDVPATVVQINRQTSANPLQDALANLQNHTAPLIIEIEDSATYALNLAVISGVENQAGVLSLRLGRSLWIRAATGQRPVIVLAQPLRFRPADVLGAGAADIIQNMEVRLEGLYITWDRNAAAFAATSTGLIARAAVHRLVLDGCTLDPGGALQLDGTADGTRQSMRTGLQLSNDYGFGNPAEASAFDQIPRLELHRSICGAIAADSNYLLTCVDSIIDAGSGVEAQNPALAVGAASGKPETAWGPELSVRGMTCFGRMRVTRADGEGGIWVHRLEAHDNQAGCIKFSYFSGDGDRLPPHHGCVFRAAADLGFASEWLGQSGYAQIRLHSDCHILEQGPGRDAMGAFGYLQNTHKWKNINIRYREFMPVGIRPVLIPIT